MGFKSADICGHICMFCDLKNQVFICQVEQYCTETNINILTGIHEIYIVVGHGIHLHLTVFASVAREGGD